MDPKNDLTTKYLVNCAVLVTCGTEKILVDGLFSGRQQYDIMDPAMEQAIINGTGEFENLRYVIATHCHNDHYNGSKIIRCLQENPGITLIVPGNARLDPERLAGCRGQIIRMNGDIGVVKELADGPFRIEYMKSGHLTFRYPEHYCVNIVCGDSNVLLTADMDIGQIPLLGRFTRKEDSVIYANSIMMWHRKWREQLKDLGYRRINFYHIASADRDFLGYRKRALRYWEKFRSEFPGGMLMNCPEAPAGEKRNDLPASFRG